MRAAVRAYVRAYVRACARDSFVRHLHEYVHGKHTCAFYTVTHTKWPSVHVPGALLNIRDRLDSSRSPSLTSLLSLFLSLPISPYPLFTPILQVLFLLLLPLPPPLTNTPNVRAACPECSQQYRRSFSPSPSCRLTARPLIVRGTIIAFRYGG